MWELITQNKKFRKEERKHALAQESDQENDQEKYKVFGFKKKRNFIFNQL